MFLCDKTFVHQKKKKNRDIYLNFSNKLMKPVNVNLI